MTAPHIFEREAIPHMEALRAYAFTLSRNKHVAEDLVQETMLKACLYFHTYREGSNCRAWLFQICKNSFINNYRRKKYEPILVQFEDDPARFSVASGDDHERELHPVPVDDGLSAMQERLFGDEVAGALNEIPHEYQTAVVLSDIEGHTYEEIADFMRAPIGTIRSRIHRGRRLLARRLETYARRNGFGSGNLGPSFQLQ